MLIGGVELRNPFLLAPMAGVTVAPVRAMACDLGVGATHTEMVSTTALVRGSRKTEELLKSYGDDNPLFVQVFGPDPVEMQQGTEIALNGRKFVGVSINMACPMPKVTKRGAGAALMERPEVAAEMVRRLSSFNLPIWVKIRKFADQPFLNTCDLIEKLLNAGAATVTVHGRTPSQRYEGVSDQHLIAQLAKAFPEKILASGDMFTVDQVQAALHDGAVGVMIARGFVKDPLLISDLSTSQDVLCSSEELERRLALLRRFMDRLSTQIAPRLALVMIKRFLPGLLRGIQGSGTLRRLMADVHQFNDVQLMIDRCFKSGKEYQHE